LFRKCKMHRIDGRRLNLNDKNKQHYYYLLHQGKNS
jgi:hypothetical protein